MWIPPCAFFFIVTETGGIVNIVSIDLFIFSLDFETEQKEAAADTATAFRLFFIFMHGAGKREHLREA